MGLAPICHLRRNKPVSKPKRYNPRHPERTLLYQTVAEHYRTWLELACSGQFDGQTADTTSL